MVKYVNERFFDSEGKAPDELKAMWYISGISFSQYHVEFQRDGSHRNKWQSTSKDLIGIVKSALESEHAIYPIKNRHIRTGEEFLTYYLSIGRQRIYDDLSKRGLDVPKEERAFPEVEEQYLDHFVRGFFDAHVSCRNITVQSESKYNPHPLHYQLLWVRSNAPFLKSLYDVLVENANVKGGREITKSPLYFGTADTRTIYDFIYRDWEFIQENGLYLPSKKELFDKVSANELIRTPYSSNPIHIAAKNRIDRAKELLLEGMSGVKVAEELNYSTPSALFRAFKKATGQTIIEFKKANKF